MIKRALNINEEKVLINKTLQCLDVRTGIVHKCSMQFVCMIILFGVIQQKDATNKSRGNLAEDDALDWLKPRTLIRPDDQEEVPEAVRHQTLTNILITDWHAHIKRESREQRLASVVRMRTVSYDYVGCQYLNFKFKTIETIF